MTDIYKTIIKNQSFGKGMTMGMKVITDNNGDHIHMHNSYFGGAVYQVYSRDTNITSLKFQLQMMYSPIWLLKKMGSMGSANSKSFFIENKDINITFTGYNGQLVHNIEKEGITLNGNIENIETLKGLRSQLSRARDIIKHNSIETILNCEAFSNTNTSFISSCVTSVVHNLDYDKFFELQWK